VTTEFTSCDLCGQPHARGEPCPITSSLRVLDDVQLDAEPDPQWDIEDMTQEGTLEILYGPTGSGKTTAAAERACCLATGLDYFGKKILQPGPVIYCALEGLGAFKKKIRAFKRRQSIPLSKRIGIYTIPDALNLLDPRSVSALIEANADIRARDIMTDTLARSILADEENAEMGRVVAHADLIRSRTNARVTLIHHSGKDRKRGARGGSALTAAADTGTIGNHGTIGVLPGRAEHAAGWGIRRIVVSPKGITNRSIQVGTVAQPLLMRMAMNAVRKIAQGDPRTMLDRFLRLTDERDQLQRRLLAVRCGADFPGP
jgi:AAA domain